MLHRAAPYAFLLALAAAPQQAAPVPTIRVLVRSAAPSLTLESRGPVEVLKPGLPKPLLAFPKLPSSTVTLKDGRFTLGGRPFEEKWLTLRAKDPAQPFDLGERSYPGDLHLIASGAGFQVVNEIDLETYALGVVPAEIGAGAPIEAMKAQAICARSYAVARMGGFREAKGRPDHDVVDDTRDQVYVGVPAANTNLRKAVEATAGMYVTWKGGVVCTYFSSSCGGHTLPAGNPIPPLSGVPCGFCGESAPNGRWEVRLTLAELGRKLSSRVGQKPVLRVSVLGRNEWDRAATVLVEHAAGRAKIAGADFRDAVGGRNTMFRIRAEGESVIVTGTGFGHGVGLCQVGCQNMAAAGRPFRDILAHYFPKHELSVLYGPLAVARRR